MSEGDILHLAKVAKVDIKQNGQCIFSVDKLLVQAGLAPSMAEARRKRAENAVKIGEVKPEEEELTRDTERLLHPAPAYLHIVDFPVILMVKLGKRTKLITIE